jgi:hypothetical protein
MKKAELRKNGILKRVFTSRTATSLSEMLKSVHAVTLDEFDPQLHVAKLADRYVYYDERKKIRVHLLELERQRVEAAAVGRRSTFT